MIKNYKMIRTPTPIICIQEISPASARDLCEKITLNLPEYFGLIEANEQYFKALKLKQSFAAKFGDSLVGLISLEYPYPLNCNIYWMGILKEFHRMGIGGMLLESAQARAIHNGAKSITVETLAPKEQDENYMKTYNFYSSQGFRPLFDLKPSGYHWNMVYMLKTFEDTKVNFG